MFHPTPPHVGTEPRRRYFARVRVSMVLLTVGRRPDEYNQAAGLAIDIVNGGPQSYDEELVIMSWTS